MDRKLYLIPALVSVALHGILFLNRSEALPPPPPPPPEVTGTCDGFPVDLDPEPTRFDLADDTPPAGKLGGNLPSLEELLRTSDNGEFTIEIAPTRPSSAKCELTHIGPPGIPEGVIGGEIGGEGKGSLGAIRAVDLDATPNARYRMPPRYPDSAKRDGIEGDVLVDFLVNERGEVVRVNVINSSDPRFVEPTRAAVLRWRFAPGLKNGKVVPFKMRVPVRFSFNNEA